MYTREDILFIPWYVVVDDCVGGYAVMSIDKRPSELDQVDRVNGDGEIAVMLPKDIAIYITMLHNNSAASLGDFGG